MTNFGAAHANKINSLDGLIYSFAVEDAALEFFDANTQQLLVLTFDFSPASFIFGQVGIFIAGFRRFGEPVQITLGGFGLVDFRHRLAKPPLSQAPDEAAILLADEKKPSSSVTCEERNLALGATAGAQMLVLLCLSFFGSSRFFFRHLLPAFHNGVAKKLPGHRSA
jgi:hypothetical protein